MLDDFLTQNRDEIIARARARVALRAAPRATELELTNGIPVFLRQLGETLRLSTSHASIDLDQIAKSAGRHGLDLLSMGLTIGQVVHDYGDICQTITELAVEQKAPISSQEFRTLNFCLDDAIAGAVTEYSAARARAIEEDVTERIGMLAHELRNSLNTALLAFDSIKSGHVPVGGSTALVLGRSLARLRDLIDRSLADVRLDAGTERHETFSVQEFLEEIEIGAAIQAQGRVLQLEVAPVDLKVSIEGDRQILAAAIANLLQNAFKFTPRHGHVLLTARVIDDHVLFDIEDECGGLPEKPEDLFRSFEQRGRDRSGVGLGLSICRKAARAHAGELRVRDIPGKGCVFTLDLPRKQPPKPTRDGTPSPVPSVPPNSG